MKPIQLNEEQLHQLKIGMQQRAYFFHEVHINKRTLEAQIVTSFALDIPWKDEQVNSMYRELKQEFTKLSQRRIAPHIVASDMNNYHINQTPDGLRDFLQSWNGTDFTVGIDPLKDYIRLEQQQITRDLQQLTATY